MVSGSVDWYLHRLIVVRMLHLLLQLRLILEQVMELNVNFHVIHSRGMLLHFLQVSFIRFLQFL